MLGLPGSGKSSWINDYVKLLQPMGMDDPDSYELVSADDIRLVHPDYDPQNPELIHEECIRLAKERVFDIAKDGFNIVMDGGGINNSYIKNIVLKLKEMGYTIKVVFIDTPVEICIQRNLQRVNHGERFVKTSAIIDKAYRLVKSVELLKELADEFVTVEYFTNKYVFVDLDGTVAEYQNLPVDEYGDIDFVGYGVFKNSKPVMEVINKVQKLHDEGKQIYIVSASPNSIASEEKLEWVKKYLPFIMESRIFFVGNKNYKYVFLKQLIKKMKFNTRDCTVIDDDHNVLLSYQTLFINTVHPSKFLSNF